MITVGEVTQTRAFSIKPLNLEFINTPSSIRSHQKLPVSLKVTDDEGEPVVGVEVDFHSNFGRFRSGSVRTDANGIATQRFHSGFNANAREPKLYARVGLVKAPAHQITLDNGATHGTAAIDATNAMVIGDAAQAGIVNYQRFDGQGLTLPYQTSTGVQVSGEHESLALSLGDLGEPNRAPYAAYLMQELFLNQADDATGLHPAQVHSVEVNQGIESDNTQVPTAELLRVAHEHPNGVGRSYYFKNKSLASGQYVKAVLKSAAADTLKPQYSTGFRLELKPEAYNSTLFDLANGNQSLRLDEDGLLTYQMTTEHGSVSIQSARPIALNQWHKVAVRYQNGLLELQVDDQERITQAVNGQLDYGIAQTGLVIGDEYQGYLSSLRFYDWDTEPLLTFADGSTETQLDFESRQTQAIQLLSTGNLNRQYDGSQLNLLTVPLIKGTERHPIGLISKAFYANLAGFYFSQSGHGPPLLAADEANAAINPIAMALNTFVVPAHANIMSQAWDIMKELAAYAIPYGELIGMVEQLWYLFTDDEQFDPFELAINTVGVLTFFPPLKVIKPLIGPIQKFYRGIRGRPFMGAFADVFMKMGNDLLKGKFDKVWQLFPFILMAGEMLRDEESRAALMIMVDSISSSDDLFAWTEYLAMPVDGWEGNEVPKLDMFNPDSEQNQPNAFMDKVSPFFIKSAHAANRPPRRTGTKIDADKFTVLLREATKVIRNASGEVNGKALVGGIKSMSKAMKELPSNIPRSEKKWLRKLTFGPYTLLAATKLKSRHFNNIMKNVKKLRMSPLAIMAIVYYLEERRNGCVNADPICKEFPQQVKDKIPGIYVKAFGGQGFGDIPSGYLFQLAMIAVKQLKYEVTQEPYTRVVQVESRKTMRLVCFDDKTAPTYKKCDGYPRYRDVDIVTQGDESSGVGNKNIWVELKSKKGQKRSSRNASFTTYTNHEKAWSEIPNILKSVGSDKRNAHYRRQFYFDRVATTENDLRVFQGNPEINTGMAKDFEWWMHKYTKEKEGGYTNTHIDFAASKVKNLPKTVKDGRHFLSLGYRAYGLNRSNYSTNAAKQHFRPGDIKGWILNQARYLLRNQSEEVINELIRNNDG